MPFRDFMERENVYAIIKDTLENNNLGVLSFKKDKNKGIKYYAFPRLGVLITKSGLRNKSFIQNINRNWSFPNNYKKRTLVKVYLFLVLLLPNLFADKVLYLNDSKINSSSVVFPGNKKIKIVDYESRTVTNILKTSFKNTWILKEIEFRTKNSYIDNILPLKAGINSYIEPFLIGFSYTRLPSNTQNKLLERIIKFSQNLSRTKVVKKDALDYALERKNYVAELLKKRLYGFYYEFKSIVDAFLDFATSVNNFEIFIEMSHGDFQKGNIFYTLDNQLYVLDWETPGMRIKHYDLITFFNNTRNSNNSVKFVKNVCQKGEISLGSTNIIENSTYSYLKLFLLEDFIWQIEESEILDENMTSTGLKNYIKFIPEIIKTVDRMSENHDK